MMLNKPTIMPEVNIDKNGIIRIENRKDALDILDARDVELHPLTEFPDDFRIEKGNPELGILEDTFFIQVPHPDPNEAGKMIELETDEFAFKHLLERIKGSKIDWVKRCYQTDLLNKNTMMMDYLKDMFKNCWDTYRSADNNKARTINYHLCSDVFQNSIRAFTTDSYEHLADSKIVTAVEKRLPKAYNFQSAQFNPLSSTVNFTSNEFKVRGDIHRSGISVTNSEFRYGSVKIQVYIERMVCSNGLWGDKKESSATIKHLRNPEEEKSFMDLVDKALIKVVNTQGEFEKAYRQLESLDKPIFEEWQDLMEHKSKFHLRKNNMQELIEIGKKSKYPKDQYGLLNALTEFKTHHKPLHENLDNTIEEMILSASLLDFIPN
jgi:uncharacterized protein DUF932